ncbi:MAG: IclR family transcriptional regulator [Rhodovibrionaceae bacterium]
MKASSLGMPTERALLVLEYLAERKVPVSIREIATDLSIPKPTANRLIALLIHLGFVSRWPGRTVTIAARLLDLASSVMRAYAESPAVNLVLKGLASDIGESVSIGAMIGGELIYLHSVDSSAPLALYFRKGQTAPLHCTSSGKVHLSLLSDETLEKFLSNANLERHTLKTITSKFELIDELTKVRHQGHAKSIEEYVVGVAGAAVPIYDSRDNILAALSVAGPVTRLDYSKLEELIPRLKESAAKLTDSAY